MKVVYSAVVHHVVDVPPDLEGAVLDVLENRMSPGMQAIELGLLGLDLPDYVEGEARSFAHVGVLPPLSEENRW